MRLKNIHWKTAFTIIYLSVVFFCHSCGTALGATEVNEPNQTNLNKQPDWNRPRSNERMNDRKKMVEVIRDKYGLKDKTVLDAVLNVPRHWFVPRAFSTMAYTDRPLPIGHNQTISQPFIVAYMTSLLELTSKMKVLEIGTGSGYQAAVLSEFTPNVYTIEIVEPLAKTAQQQLSKRGYNTIKVKIGDGYKGWPEHAPFDAIIVTCAPEQIPQPLIDQLKTNGKIVIPVGKAGLVQKLLLVTKKPDGSLEKKPMMPVRFVPLTRKE
ncbi:MAG: protein-L-isoaspartate(D-aspartate) O-methyltransferase [Sedimentisphaerales bacterium]|nr:protein-L-isoaspartate(D-aspartate) O-methyltransferase [Sedimentisphaerales bacterium]